MGKLFTSIMLFFSLTTVILAQTIDLEYSKGMGQDAVSMLIPSPAEKSVPTDVVIKALFNVSLDPAHIKKNDVKLVHISDSNKHIEGEVAYVPENKTVIFKPKKPLKVGVYELTFKSLKAVKEQKEKHIKEIKYRFYVPEVINGYMLPPEPDETINNLTLLGIDFNENGVRDDVERKIVNVYQTPIKIELMLSYARSHQEMLHDPIGSAIASQKKMQKATNCNMYLFDENLAVENIVEFTENNMYNTKQRIRAYLDFNKALSGGVYGSGPADWNAEACDFNVEQMLKDRK